jgi:hypothetical protein
MQGSREEWNTYDVVAVDGILKLSVNGKFVNGISHDDAEEGLYFHGIGRSEDLFRNIRIMELPPGVTSPGSRLPGPNRIRGLGIKRSRNTDTSQRRPSRPLLA